MALYVSYFYISLNFILYGAQRGLRKITIELKIKNEQDINNIFY